MYRLMLIVACVLGLDAAALAQLIYPLQQERRISVMIDTVDGNDARAASATNFDEWLADLGATLDFNPNEFADALQYSTIGDAALDAYGDADLQIWRPEFGTYWSGTGRTEQHYRVRFAVPAATTYALTGSLGLQAESQNGSQSNWHADADLSVQMRQIAGAETCAAQAALFVSTDDPNASSSQPLTMSGLLSPGVYEFELTGIVQAWANGTFPAYYDYPLTVYLELAYIVNLDFAAAPPPTPCNADLDGDGDVDMIDFARTQECFTGPHP